MPSYAAPPGSSLYCSSCSSAVEQCHPRSRPQASARTEAEKWFSRSPFCSQHSHDIVALYQGKAVGLEELWRRKWQGVAPRSRSSYRHEDGHDGREMEREWDRRSRSRDYRSTSNDYRSRSRDERSRDDPSRDDPSRDDRSRNDRSRDDRSRSKKMESPKDKRTRKTKGKKSSSDSDSDGGSSSDEEDVEERYCRACELALAKCRIWNAPNPNARLESQKYFLSPPVCFMHFRSKDVVRDDEIISLEDLWKEMKAKEPCEVCDAAKKAARPLTSPYDSARTEGEKYFSPAPFCGWHRKREDIVYEDELVSVRKYWKALRKKEVCMACEGAKKWCSPLQTVNDHAFTEGRRWFYPSPLCLMHKDRRKILVDGEMIKMEDYWKMRVKAAREAARSAEKRGDSQRRDSVSSEERGRSRNDGRQRRGSQLAPDLLSPYDAALPRPHSRGRGRSTIDPLRHTTDTGTQDRRRPRSYDAHRSYDDHRRSHSPSPYPAEWTDDQKKKYFECFRTLAQPQQAQDPTRGPNGHLSPPPPAKTANSHPPATAPVASPSVTSSATADYLSPRSATNRADREANHVRGSDIDPSGNSQPDQSSQTDDNRSLVEKLGIRSPSPGRP